MRARERPTVTVSTKGQVALPEAAPAFAATCPEEVFGCLAASGPARSLEEMEAGVLAEAKRRHAGD